MRHLPFLIVSCFVLCCVSASVYDQRFQESISLPIPTNGVTVADPNNFTFAIVGDLHIEAQNTTRLKTILQAAAGEGDSFVILLGDIVDKGIREDVVAVQNEIKNQSFQQKVFPVIGNHDIFGDGWLHYKTLNGASHYTFQIGNSKFIAVDSADATLGETQFDWLEQELSKPNPGNIFVLSHYLPIVAGQRTYLKIANDEEASRLMKLSANHHVTAWLGGHYHSYIVGEVEGVNYVVAGGGGGRRMEPVKDHFFAQVTVSPTGVSYSMKPVP